MKFFGRLSGSTHGPEALSTTAPPSTQLPFVAQTPGSKFIAYGEFASAAAQNRPLAALQENIEFLADILFSPGLRDDQLEYERTSSGVTYGFSALKDVAQGATEISLGLGAYTPAVWVYHGVHSATVDQFLRATRHVSASTANGACSVAPSDVLQYSGGPSVFPSTTINGSWQHALSTTIAPVRRVRPDVYPYEGATASLAVERWEEDGPVVEDGYTWSQFLARPGCFVEISGTDLATENNGLYRLVNVRRAASGGDKAVLTRGGLHRVRVSDATNFTAGERLAWASSPNHTSDAAVVRDNFAYVVYIIDNYLYLSQLTAGEDFPTLDDVAARVNTDIAEYGGRKAVGNVGFPDQEEDTTSNWSLPVGTLLFNPADDYAVVLEVLPAGYPVSFTTGALPGQAFVCNPVGFALNPALVFSSDELLEGDYTVDCRTLTTVREQLVSQGSSAARGEFEDPSGPLGISREELSLLKSYLRSIKSGEQLLTVNTNDWYAPTAQVLGASRWRITVENTTDADITADSFLSPNTTLLITIHPTATGVATTRCRVVSCAGNQLVLSNVSIVGWNQVARRTVAPIIANAVNGSASGFSLSGNLFYVRSIEASPALTSTAGAHGVPYPGLDAAYNNAFSPNEYDRGAGSGRYVEVLSGKPISMLLHPTNDADRPVATDVLYDTNSEGTGGGCSAVRISQRSSGTAKVIYGYKSFIYEEGASAIETAFVGAAGTVLTLGLPSHTVLALLSFTSGILKFSDLNTGLGYRIPFTTTNDLVPSKLPLSLQAPSILGALHGLDLADHDTAPAVDRDFAVTGSGLLYAEGSKTPLDFYPDRRTTFEAGRTLTFSDSSHATVGGAGAVAINASSVLFIEYHSANGTPLTQYIGVASYTHPNLVLEAAFAGFAVDDTVARTDWGAVSNPLSVVVADHYVVVLGRKYHVEATTLTATANSTQYVVYSMATNAVTLVAAGDPLVSSATTLTVGRVRTTAAVAQIEGFPDQVGRQEHKTELFVGGASSDEYTARKTHFNSISDAFKYIELHTEDLQYIGRTWVINVRGSVTETEDHAHGVLHPLNVPADGVVIRGAHTNGTAHVSWATKTSLFCTNGKRGFTLENVTFAWTGSWTSAAGLATGLRADQGVAVVSNVTYADAVYRSVHMLSIDKVRCINAPALLYLENVEESGTVVVRDVYASGLRTRPVYVTARSAADSIPLDTDTDASDTFGLESLLVDNCVFDYAADADPQTVDDCGIYTLGVRSVDLRGGRISGSYAHGAHLSGYLLASCLGMQIIDCNKANSATNAGLYFNGYVASSNAVASGIRVSCTAEEVNAGIGVLVGGSGVVDGDSRIENFACGAKLTYSDARIESCKIVAPTTFGIWHHGAGTASRHNSIYMAGATTKCLYVDGPGATVEDNDTWAADIDTFAGSGIYVRASVSLGSPNSCSVVGNRTHGASIVLTAGSEDDTYTVLAANHTQRDASTDCGALMIDHHGVTTRNNVVGTLTVSGDRWISQGDRCSAATLNSAGCRVTGLFTTAGVSVAAGCTDSRFLACVFTGAAFVQVANAGDTQFDNCVFDADAEFHGAGTQLRGCTFKSSNGVLVTGAHSYVHGNTTCGNDLSVTGGYSSVLNNLLIDVTGGTPVDGVLTVGGGNNKIGGNQTSRRVVGWTSTDRHATPDRLYAEVEVHVARSGDFNSLVGDLYGLTYTVTRKLSGPVSSVVPTASDNDPDATVNGLITINFDSSAFPDGVTLSSGCWQFAVCTLEERLGSFRNSFEAVVRKRDNDTLEVMTSLVCPAGYVPNEEENNPGVGALIRFPMWASFRLQVFGPYPSPAAYTTMFTIP